VIRKEASMIDWYCKMN